MSVPSHFGRYRVLKPIAAGEMGVVYLADDPLIGRQVAIKSIRLHMDTDDADVRRLQARFDQEIHIAGTFSHPNIVTLFDVGRQNGAPFIAMEYIEGRDLRAEMQACGPLDVARAVGIGAAVARALSYAHERKVVHRDIKPTNILMSSAGDPKITDFGVARLFGSTLTHHGHIFGTPAYMSPEQARGDDLSGASDQFGIAAVLYELLTGERPFKGTSATGVIYEVIEHHPAPPHAVAPLVPTPVGEVVMKAMNKLPEDRFADCNEFATALEHAMSWSRAHPDRAYLEGMPADEGVTAEIDAAAAPRATLPQTAAAASAAAVVWAISARRAVSRVVQGHGTVAAIAIVALGFGVLWLASAASRAGAVEPDTTPTATLDIATQRVPLDVAVTRPAIEPDAIATPAASVPQTDAATDPLDALTFTIRTRPATARITFDGERLDAASPVTVHVRQMGTHLVRAELDGYDTVSWSFSAAELSSAQMASRELYFPLRRTTAAEDEIAAGASPWNPDPLRAAPANVVDSRNGRAAIVDEPSAGTPPAPTNVRRIRAPAQAPTPEKLQHVDPVAPDGSDSAVVVIEIEVSARGNVVQAKVLRGATPAIDQAALAAVVRWKYAPTIVSGSPVRVLMTVTLPIG